MEVIVVDFVVIILINGNVENPSRENDEILTIIYIAVVNLNFITIIRVN